MPTQNIDLIQYESHLNVYGVDRDSLMQKNFSQNYFFQPSDIKSNECCEDKYRVTSFLKNNG